MFTEADVLVIGAGAVVSPQNDAGSPVHRQGFRHKT
jgi:hypothetical protein